MNAIAKCPAKQRPIEQACPMVRFPVKASPLTRHNDYGRQTPQWDSKNLLMLYTKIGGVFPV